MSGKLTKTRPYAKIYEPVPFTEREDGDSFPVWHVWLPHIQPSDPITTLHLHDCLEVGYCVQGQGTFVVEDKVFSFRPGDVVVINEREMHAVRSLRDDNPVHGVYLWTDPMRLLGPVVDDLAVLRTDHLCGPGFRNIFPGSEMPELVTVIQDMWREMNGARPHYQSAVRAMFWALMARLQRLPGIQPQGATAFAHGGAERVSPALRHIAGHYAEAVTSTELADLCHMSETNFRRVFHSAMGVSPMKHLANVRVRMAATLLTQTSRRITDISMDVGYEALGSFIRNFEEVMGVSPGQWRQNNGQSTRKELFTPDRPHAQ